MPPVADKVMVAASPLHNTDVEFEEAVRTEGEVMVTNCVAVHPLEHVTVQLYTPDESPVIVAVVPPLDHM